MEYRWVATSVEGFIRQLAIAYITHGYWFYVAGVIPEGKDPAVVDAKLIERYGIAISKWARCRRKKQGLANMQYLRHGRFFLLLATKGRHGFFERERASIRDVRRKSIKVAGYSIGCRKGRDGRWHASVRIEHALLVALKSGLMEAGLHHGSHALGTACAEIRHLTFGPIRRQLLGVLRSVNRVRRTAGLNTIDFESIGWRRQIVRPFEVRMGMAGPEATTTCEV